MKSSNVLLKKGRAKRRKVCFSAPICNMCAYYTFYHIFGDLSTGFIDVLRRVILNVITDTMGEGKDAEHS